MPAEVRCCSFSFVVLSVWVAAISDSCVGPGRHDGRSTGAFSARTSVAPPQRHLSAPRLSAAPHPRFNLFAPSCCVHVYVHRCRVSIGEPRPSRSSLPCTCSVRRCQVLSRPSPCACRTRRCDRRLPHEHPLSSGNICNLVCAYADEQSARLFRRPRCCVCRALPVCPSLPRPCRLPPARSLWSFVCHFICSRFISARRSRSVPAMPRSISVAS